MLFLISSPPLFILQHIAANPAPPHIPPSLKNKRLDQEMRQVRGVCARGHLLPSLARSAYSRTAVPPQNNKSPKDTKYPMQPTTLMQQFLAYLIFHS